MIKSKYHKNSRYPKKYNYGNKEMLTNIFSKVNSDLKKNNIELKGCKSIGIDYKIIKYLASGTFGKVSFAVDKSTKKNIIVKEIEISNFKIYKTGIDKHIFIKFIENELKHLALFSEIIPQYICPLICVDVKIPKIFFKSPKIIIIMEYCGKSMGEILIDVQNKKIPYPSLDTVLTWFYNIINALHIIHKNNIIHLDIKPENILVKENGNIAIIDFGVSQSIDDYNKYRIPVGTPRYIAPEIVNRNIIRDGKSDIYSLGVTLNYFVNIYPILKPLVNDMVNPNVFLRPTALEVRQKILMITRQEDSIKKVQSRAVGNKTRKTPSSKSRAVGNKTRKSRLNKKNHKLY